MLHPDRVNMVTALSLPYQERGEIPWVDFIESFLGSDQYIVHFNRHPGEADAVLDKNRLQFLRNLYRKNEPIKAPEPGMAMINLAMAETSAGEPLMSDRELAVFDTAFETSGFTSSINWYRNLDRNWHLLAKTNPVIQHSALMIYGDRDLVPKSPNLSDFVPNVEVVTLHCGHWIQQEKPEETTQAIVNWLDPKNAT
ncbi:MAG: alpha/beta hydrolase [Roseibium sp.]|uniref:alpha/beta fold hydrolase n=1 Tax=Roseibium sp. TaxID=1936156 RepID=UPI0026302921|nr:alpha/beta hydrolase [Roseibium sp.]MCV0426762.1 alpha/beta hydrolase [Roseibium sp.]